MGGDVPRRTPDSLVFGDLSKDVFCVLIVYSCRSVGVCREVFRVRVRLYVCEQILQQYFQFERVQKKSFPPLEQKTNESWRESNVSFFCAVLRPIGKFPAIY